MKVLQNLLAHICLSTLLALSSASQAAPAGWAPLLSPPELNAILHQTTDVRLIHITGDFSAGHIPGAAHAAYAEFRGPQNNPGSLPSIEALTTLLQRLGIDADTPVVIVHEGSSAAEMGAATRVYWTLKSLGVESLAVLNGGFNAWQAQLLPVNTDAANIPASDFEPRWNDQWQISADEIQNKLGSEDMNLVDARPPAFFNGSQAAASRAGTIPGASNLSFTSLFDNNHMRDRAQLSEIMAAASKPEAAMTVSFCNSGQLASINWFAMSELEGKENVKLYAESMIDWAQSDRPMANEP